MTKLKAPLAARLRLMNKAMVKRGMSYKVRMACLIATDCRKGQSWAV